MVGRYTGTRVYQCVSLAPCGYKSQGYVYKIKDIKKKQEEESLGCFEAKGTCEGDEVSSVVLQALLGTLDPFWLASLVLVYILIAPWCTTKACDMFQQTGLGSFVQTSKYLRGLILCAKSINSFFSLSSSLPAL